MSDPILAALTTLAEAGEFAGAATLIWQDGKVVHTGAVGWRDIEARLPVKRDTIFRLASMTKPVTSAAALMLLEEGRFALNDPITRVAPEFAAMRVLRAPSAPLDQCDAADRPITFDDLLTHRSGVTYGSFHTGPIAEAYERALGGDIDSSVAPDDWIAGLASLPLIDQPGRGFHYGHSTDLLGLLIARMEDAPLGDVLERRIFRPLGMKDTGFTADRKRRATMYGFDAAGRLAARPVGPAGTYLAERPDTMTYVSGGQGLWSTLDDFLAFARMFLGAGAVDGVRLLRPETLALMTANRLTPAQRSGARLLGMPVFAAHGFGLGVAVVLDPDRAAAIRCKGAVGTVGWPGAYGGWWQADASAGSILIFLAHNVVELDQLANGVGLGVWGAIEQFHGLASARPRAATGTP